ncbi:murein L,D-transpeptidase [Ferrimonas sp. SCSIO 43195]|uniref:L,D-transpeptidase family protein n=1 Tax=Ferrimonas sp. SCSIO 43195 TaxID=2822844 RepID=UPI00207579CB|nr:L,D-transpeptidase family protein [Ferrimonas sp. SCSIO 43195]USD38838.1 L,D-transpeptidase family protein [Ferrimonas sp. SCSIO 43195]
MTGSKGVAVGRVWWLVLALVLVSSGITAAPLWFDNPAQRQAGQELRKQVNFMAAANVSHQFNELQRLLNQEALTLRQQSELLTEAYLLIQGFNQTMASRPIGADQLGQMPLHLTSPEGSAFELATAVSQQRLIQLVIDLEPRGSDYLAARHWVEQLQQMVHLNWPRFNATRLIEPHQRHVEVEQIRVVLKLLNDYQGPVLGQEYDADLVAAVQRFQRRHGLAADGVIGPKTRSWLSMSPAVRAQRLARNILRQSHDRRWFAQEYLLVNIPDFSLRWVTPEGQRFQSRVIVGRNSRRTPRMATEMVSVVVNPSWNVPRSIVRKDLIPKIRRNGDYLAQQHFDAYDWQGSPVEKTPQQWQQASYGRFPFRLSQRPGNRNALGRYKFHLTNNQAIYLHDTPKKSLFDKPSRAFSSGCVRVQDADLLARQLVQYGDISEARFVRSRRSNATQWFKMQRPLPVYLVYWSAWMGQDHKPRYRRDLYHQEGDLDHKMTIAMGHQLSR